ncbi:unnamed protein product [Orchesella dallaii]|uniref:Uncharacterized protein n=1 Tax=Orchesella dallaii TaxID=48710 RepID=A0ABP1QMI4_9HEXA
MSSTGSVSPAPKESQRKRTENVWANEKIKLLVQFARKCDAVKRVAKSATALHMQVKHEVFECRFQENHYFHLRNKMTRAVTAGLIDGQLASIVQKKFEEFIPKIRKFEMKLEHGSQKLAHWIELNPLGYSDYEWVKATFVKDPEGLRKEIEEVKTKIDTESQYFKQMKAEWDANKENLSKEIESAIRVVEVLILVFS